MTAKVFCTCIAEYTQSVERKEREREIERGGEVVFWKELKCVCVCVFEREGVRLEMERDKEGERELFWAQHECDTYGMEWTFELHMSG